jgi:hypothetical protein
LPDGTPSRTDAVGGVMAGGVNLPGMGSAASRGRESLE